METHTIEVAGIPDELLELLDERVRQRGGDRASFIRELIRKELQRDVPPSDEGPLPQSGMSFDELLSPVHEQAAARGITEDEMERLFEEARERVREEKRAARRQ
jgi:hypothetical protein